MASNKYKFIGAQTIYSIYKNNNHERCLDNFSVVIYKRRIITVSSNSPGGFKRRPKI